MINVTDTCSFIEHNPFWILGSSTLLLNILIPFIVFYACLDCSPTRGNPNGYVFGDKFWLPCISETWRNKSTYPLACASLSLNLIIYNGCLESVGLRVLITVMLVYVLLVYMINEAEGLIAVIHGCIAALLFIGILILSWFITADYFGWDDPIGITFFVLLVILFTVLFTSVLWYHLRIKNKDTGNIKKHRRWYWWICLVEILYASLFLIYLILINQ